MYIVINFKLCFSKRVLLNFKVRDPMHYNLECKAEENQIRSKIKACIAGYKLYTICDMDSPKCLAYSVPTKHRLLFYAYLYFGLRAIKCLRYMKGLTFCTYTCTITYSIYKGEYKENKSRTGNQLLHRVGMNIFHTREERFPQFAFIYIICS